MEKKRKIQILKKLEDTYQAWKAQINISSNVDNIEEIVELVGRATALGTIVLSQSRALSAYIGTHTQCDLLKEKFDGQVGCVSNVWYWIGGENTDDISSVVKNLKKNLIITVPDDDFLEMTLLAGEMMSLDIVYAGDEKNGRVCYLGAFKPSCLLKKKFGGRIGKSYNLWYWIGNADFDAVSPVYKAYQQKEPRYRRKKIVLKNS